MLRPPANSTMRRCSCFCARGAVAYAVRQGPSESPAAKAETAQARLPEDQSQAASDHATAVTAYVAAKTAGCGRIEAVVPRGIGWLRCRSGLPAPVG